MDSAERIIQAFDVFQSGRWPHVDEDTMRRLKYDVAWIRQRYDNLKWGDCSFSEAAMRARVEFINTFFRLTPLAADASIVPADEANLDYRRAGYV